MKPHPFRSSPPIQHRSPQLAEAACVRANATIVPRFWFIDGGSGWLVRCDTTKVKARARTVADVEFHRGSIREVRAATEMETETYCHQKGCTRHSLVEDWRRES